MKSYKKLLNSLSKDDSLRKLTDAEIARLRCVFLEAFCDLSACCEKHGITVMLIGGSVLGAVRHKGFIPWDDDLDVAITRSDFEKLKSVFDGELGAKYILSSPNYRNNASNRFPKMLVKDTLFVEAGCSPEDEWSKIKIDIFIIESVPDGKLRKILKGLWCTLLMGMGSYEETYENQNVFFEHYMCKTDEGRKEYKRRLRLGKLFSFFSFQRWMNIIDASCQYKKETSLMGIPTGRGHYFGEIRPRDTFVPASVGEFEGMRVKLPHNPHDYLCNLYGHDYMTLPPMENRERHFIVDIRFKEEGED